MLGQTPARHALLENGALRVDVISRFVMKCAYKPSVIDDGIPSRDSRAYMSFTAVASRELWIIDIPFVVLFDL